MSSYRETVDYLFGLQKHGIKFGLNQTRSVLARLGNPHENLRCIHVGGTNGKGSTAAMLSSILSRHGFKVGLYSSPHLVRFTERFRINDQEVSRKCILRVFDDVRKVMDEKEPPTFFEAVTAMALVYFAREEVDWAVIEVGMGGRLDATNVIRPLASVITNIGLDHQEYLGSTLAAIAREKAGIVKDGAPVVTSARQPVVRGILQTACARHGSRLYRLGGDFRIRRSADGSFHYYGLRHRWSGLSLNLAGAHQYLNAALALATLEVLEGDGRLQVEEKALRRGLNEVRWPARLEILARDPLIVLDGAHNPQGAEYLRESLRKHFTYKDLHLVLGIMGDKDIRGMLRRLLPLAKTAIFTQPRYVRAADAEQMRQLARPYIQKHYIIPDPASAIDQARRMAGPEDLVCITGSLYFAGEVKEIFGEPTALEED